MTKTEIIEAIQSTIVANGQKGITAESLANLLIEMANATPEPEEEDNGKGQVVFYFGTPNGEDEVVLTPEQQAHNAKMVEVVKNANPAVVVTVDMTEFYYGPVASDLGISVDGMKCNMVSYLTAYFTDELAIMLGLPSGGVSLIVEVGEMMILSDGSVMPALSNE